MGRWTQFNEDATRLPVGMQRIGYDADTAQYTFSDREGNIYMGPPHEEYGKLSLVRKNSNPASPTDDDDRPHAFASDSETSMAGLSVEVPVDRKRMNEAGGSTFHDLLPSHLITSPSSAQSTLSDSPTGEPSAGSRLRDAVRRTALPAMQNAVNTVRRSATSVRRPRARDRDNEKDGLLRSGSQASSGLTRSTSEKSAKH